MTPRPAPPWLSGVVGELELDRPAVVTTDVIRDIRERLGVRPPARRIIEELHARGWLLKNIWLARAFSAHIAEVRSRHLRTRDRVALLG